MLTKIFGILFMISYCVKAQQEFLDYVSSPFLADRNLTCRLHDTKYTCDCDNSEEKFVLQQLNGHVFHISVSNCKSLSVVPNALSETQGLRSVSFTNVENLVLQGNSLAFSRYTSNMPLILEFNKVKIEEIDSHAITGNIEEVVFTNCYINTIRPFGFTALKDVASLLKFSNTVINRIEPQAFKKFNVRQLELNDIEITTNLPSKSFYDLEILNLFKIDGCRFKEVHSRAFSLKAISKLVVTNNNYERVGGEWIESGILNNILIKNNQFGITSPNAFSGITLHKDYLSSEQMEMRFLNNTISVETDLYPLEFNQNFQLIIKDLSYSNQFNCQDSDRIKDNKFFKQYSDTIYFTTHENNQQKLAHILQHDCAEPSYLIYIIIGVVVLIVIVAVIVGIAIYLYIQKKKKQKLNIVMPESKTYRETQIVLQIENAGLLKTDL